MKLSSFGKIDSQRTKVNCYQPLFMVKPAPTLRTALVWFGGPLLPASLIPLLVLTLLLAGCSGSKQQTSESSSGSEARQTEQEGTGKLKRPKLPEPPPVWGSADINVEPLEGPSDTIRFHIGSPFFLRLKILDDQACGPFQGQAFYFDAPGAQLGWGFHEVNDKLLFPQSLSHPCERIVMVSSDGSNRIAEGEYTFKLLLFVDDTHRIYSDTLVVQAVHSPTGADTLSYIRFLQEQIVNNSPLLSDPETVQALFAEGTPRSAESEIYRAVILFKGGDAGGAEQALRSAQELEKKRGHALNRTASATRDALGRTMAGTSSR